MCIRDSSKSLTELDLSANNIDVAGSLALGDCFENNIRLMKADLSYNNITRTGAISIARSLAITTLTWLDLSWNGLGEGGGQELGQLSLIHISEPTRLLSISSAVFCL
eukprot:TRINITY_DN47339_c0_g1_i1.p2 TRINITY_DN47339_c0_g1~~TRINITY_DN47339_c0_g1_i1.p2  ORF type:complete len:108 (+),score=30.80 TRINITY_DN47339_c0_g1_i1:69-392(+)